jgi:hypothetical protein
MNSLPNRKTNMEENDQPSRSDLRMIGSAVRGGWNIPDELMENLPGVVIRALKEANTTRDKEKMLKLLLEMNKQNMALIAPAAPPPMTQVNVGVNVAGTDHDFDARLSAVNERIRIDPVAGDVPATGATRVVAPAKRKKRAKKKPAAKKRPVKPRQK